MSTSTYYSFISTPKEALSGVVEHASHVVVEPHSRSVSIETHRQSAISPSSFATSSSDSSSSLYQFNSLTPTSTTSSTTSSSSSSSSSSSTTNSSNLFNRNHRDLLRQSSVTPTQTHHSIGQHAPQLFHSYTLHSLEPKPLKPFKNKSDYLEAMKEDLAEWLNRLYSDLDLTADNFFAQLETGSIICRHANNVTQMGRNFMTEQSARNVNERETLLNNGNNDNGQSEANELDSFNNDDNNCHSQNGVLARSSPTSNESSFYSSTNSLHYHYQNKNQNKQRSLSLAFNSFSPTPKLDRAGSINWFAVKTIPYKRDACPGTFFARDNICQFILWCRSLNILECLLFETDDLVGRKNEKSFILCLLEVARIGFKVGMPTPMIIQLEQEIDREIENDAKRELLEEKQNQDDSYGEDELNSSTRNQINSKQEKGEREFELDGVKLQEREAERGAEEEVEEEVEEEEEETGPKPQVVTNDLVSLHKKVVQLLCQCTCPTQFPMVRVGDNGKYKVGDKLIIFVRILRRHIMVRVGGGWQELSEFLRMKDPCRSRLYSAHQQSSHNHHHHQPLHTKFALNSTTTVPKSRFNESSHHLNKGHLSNNNNNNTSQLYTTRSAGGQRLISNSASMSWLSHNS